MSTTDRNISNDDILNICVLLKGVIDDRTIQDKAMLDELVTDKSIPKPITKIHADIMQMGLIRTEEIQDLYDRLLHMLPRHMIEEQD